MRSTVQRPSTSQLERDDVFLVYRYCCRKPPSSDQPITDPQYADTGFPFVQSLGTKIIVTNPSPLGWGSKENKTDQQLLDQAVALDKLGAELRAMGLTLAYHTHDSEFRAGAREFHHMMLATDPLTMYWMRSSG